MNTMVARMVDFIVKVMENDTDIDEFVQQLTYNVDGNPLDSDNVYLSNKMWVMGAEIVSDFRRLQEGEEE
tara:strand:+ start:462 stop:671 length:210 start_codon:yes stop_codon:yes gene_type:complete